MKSQTWSEREPRRESHRGNYSIATKNETDTHRTVTFDLRAKTSQSLMYSTETERLGLFQSGV